MIQTATQSHTAVDGQKRANSFEIWIFLCRSETSGHWASCDNIKDTKLITHDNVSDQSRLNFEKKKKMKCRETKNQIIEFYRMFEAQTSSDTLTLCHYLRLHAFVLVYRLPERQKCE